MKWSANKVSVSNVNQFSQHTQTRLVSPTSTMPTSPAHETLVAALAPIRSRQRLAIAAKRAAAGLLTAATLAIIVGVLRLIFEWPLDAVWLGTGLLLVPLLNASVAWLQSLPMTEAAKSVDQHYGLKDRTLTALEFAKLPSPSDFQRLQIADATARLQGLDPRAVIPIQWPSRANVAAGLTAASLLLCIWPLPQPPAIAKPVTHAGVEAAADAIAEEINDLKELAEKVAEKEPELKTLADELSEQLKVMKLPGTEPRKALETISEMQAKLTEQLKEFNPATVDAEMKNLSDALSLAEPFKPASAELKKGDYQSAAQELDRLKSPELDRKEARATKEKLDEAAKSMDQAGMKELSDAVQKMSDAVKDNDAEKLDEASKELAQETREQAVRKQIGQKLAKKLGRLGELKSLAHNGDQEGNRNSMQKGKNQKSERSSQTFGQGDHGKLDGTKTELSTTRQIQQLQGTLGEGDSEKETTQGEQSEETAKRKVQAIYGKYQKMSEAVLESEPIPIGQRQMIRKYFELIRPEPTEEPAAESK